MATYTNYYAVLTEGGYQQRPPARQASIADEGMAGRSRCGGCGHVGMDYRPYLREGDAGGSYRALAVCPACGEAVEF